MTENCNNKNSLQRDGTSQAQRLLAALLPEYVSVDERSMEDLIAFAKKLAEQIRYYNLADAPDGNWVDFFIQSISTEQRTAPHYALFISFLELFKIAQKDLNTITKRHLDFYYREMLRLEERPAVPDQVYIIFELAEQLSGALVPAGTPLDAKKDATGEDLVYNTDKNIVVNHGKVEQLKAVFINRPINENAVPLDFPDEIPVIDPTAPNVLQTVIENNWRIYGSPVANSADGLGADIEGEEKRWRTFGRPHPDALDGTLADRAQAEIGFAFASPLLFLAEGIRTVTITLNLQQPAFLNADVAVYQVAQLASSYETVEFSKQVSKFQPVKQKAMISDWLADKTSSALNGALNVYFSGEEEWLLPDDGGTTYYDTNGNLVIVRTLGRGKKAVVAYNEAVLLQPFKTKWPVVKITLNSSLKVTDYIYHQLSTKSVFSADLKVDVAEVKNLIIQNDSSVLATEKPFQPFGSQPVVGSTFYLGSNEIFQKKLSEFAVNITWHELPDAAKAPRGFEDYYDHYLPVAEIAKRKTSLFNVETALLDKKSWRPLNNINTGYSLFQSTGVTNNSPVDNENNIDIPGSFLGTVPRDPEMTPVSEFDATTQKGFLRMTLADVDFGHTLFQNSFAQQAVWTVQKAQDINYNPLVIGNTIGLPNAPYTPTIKEISVSYTSRETINLSRQATVLQDEISFNTRVDQFFHVLPFGVAENHPYIIKQSANISLVPQFNDEGNLYIGVSALVPPQILSVLFKVAEGSADPDFNKEQVKWSYLLHNEWFDFSQLQILAEGTNGLLTSGIVTFDLPKVFNSDNTALPAGLFWIRASVQHNSAAVCDLVNVIAQAVTATFTDNANDPDHLRLSLPAETIKDFIDGDESIDKVTQPYASFGGHIKEQSNEFYTRVSERLRHKHRGVTIWDYEHLVLEKFPTIYKVKCLQHTRFVSIGDINELEPGHVSLVIIPDLRNKNAVNPLKPKTSLITLTEISEYISTINPPCVALHVRNPIFEEIKVDFNVRFHPGFDIGFYGKQLEEELRKFLAPWAYDTKDIVFGGRIHKSRIINFVEERPYVDYVTCFNMNQIIPTGINTPPVIKSNIDEAETTTSASIFTSAPTHTIVVLETETCDCDDNNVNEPMLAPGQPCDPCGTAAVIEDGIGADGIGTSFVIGHAQQAGIDFWVIEQDFNVQ
ncbi:MAG: baseplate J/gp47 family protein [Bacteroidota bacterium]|nr:baseplate J/gp47 family protein [Bacteroidota bacterium]